MVWSLRFDFNQDKFGIALRLDAMFHIRSHEQELSGAESVGLSGHYKLDFPFDDIDHHFCGSSVGVKLLSGLESYQRDAPVRI